MLIEDLNPNPKNPRTISDAKLEQLKKALHEFGDLSAIIYNRKTNQLVGGHQRTKAIEEGSLVTITKKYPKPTRTGTVAEGYIDVHGERYSYREVSWSKHKEMAANIAANKGAGEWNVEELTHWMKELSSFDVDFDLDLTMFDAEELKEFEGVTVSEHTRKGKTGVDEDEVPEKAPARSKLGDIYVLGNHRLMCGDSTDLKTVEKLMKGAKADMVFTDPPYGVNEETRRKDKKRFGVAQSQNFSEVLGDESEDVAKKGFQTALSFSDSIIYWGANNYSFLPISRGWIVWDKRENKGTDDNGDAELAWTSVNKPIRTFYHLWKGMIKGSEHGQRRCHPTQKPIALAEWCLENCGNSRTVLDLFGGSGSTLIACEKTKRRCFMMEIDPQYCDVIVDRWEKYTGEKAKLVKTVKQPRKQ